MIEKICVSDLQKYFNQILVKREGGESKGIKSILAAILKGNDYDTVKNITLKNWNIIDFIECSQ